MDTSKIENLILKERYYLVVSTHLHEYYGFKVIRRIEETLNYNFASEISTWLPLAPNGSSAITGKTQNYFVNISRFPLAKVQNISDLFRLQTYPDRYEILQVFAGVSPSYIRVVWKIPSGVVTTELQQNIAPQQSFFDLYGFDGFTSPLHAPSKESEFFVLPSYSVGVLLYNPVTIPINPVFQFYINRLLVEPIDPDVVSKIKKGIVPARIVSLGNLNTGVPSIDDKFRVFQQEAFTGTYAQTQGCD